MIYLFYFLPLFIAVLFIPTIIAYYLLAYTFLNGLASRPLMKVLKLTSGDINIYLPDIALAALTFAIMLHIFKRMAGMAKPKIVSREGKIASVFVTIFFIFYLIQFVYAFFREIPFQALIRMFSNDAQCLYFFLPVFFFNNEKQARRLLYTVIVMSLIFPFGQMYLAISGSADVDFILQGQGTYRLGYGDFNVILAMGAIAFLVWEQKVVAAVLPLGGIIMLAHRSAYIGIVISIFAISFLKGKRLKSTLILGLVGVLVVGFLVVLQSTVSSRLLDSSMKRLEETFKATSTTVSRWGVIAIVADAFVENPVSGLGYDGDYKLRQTVATSVRSSDLLHAHNFVLQRIASSGAVGTFLLLFIISYALICSRRLIRKSGNEKIGRFFFASLLFFVVYSLMNTTLESAGYLFWMLVGTVFWHINEEKLRATKK